MCSKLPGSIPSDNVENRIQNESSHVTSRVSRSNLIYMTRFQHPPALHAFPPTTVTFDTDTHSCVSFTAHVRPNAGWQSLPAGERPASDAANPYKGRARSCGPHRRSLWREDQVGFRPFLIVIATHYLVAKASRRDAKKRRSARRRRLPKRQPPRLRQRRRRLLLLRKLQTSWPITGSWRAMGITP